MSMCQATERQPVALNPLQIFYYLKLLVYNLLPTACGKLYTLLLKIKGKC